MSDDSGTSRDDQGGATIGGRDGDDGKRTEVPEESVASESDLALDKQPGKDDNK